MSRCTVYLIHKATVALGDPPFADVQCSACKSPHEPWKRLDEQQKEAAAS